MSTEPHHQRGQQPAASVWTAADILPIPLPTITSHPQHNPIPFHNTLKVMPPHQYSYLLPTYLSCPTLSSFPHLLPLHFSLRLLTSSVDGADNAYRVSTDSQEIKASHCKQIKVTFLSPEGGFPRDKPGKTREMRQDKNHLIIKDEINHLPQCEKKKKSLQSSTKGVD